MESKSPTRKVADIIIGWVSEAKTVERLDNLRSYLSDTFLQKYKGQPDIANEYSRVDVEIARKTYELTKYDSIGILAPH